jgi:cobalt-zinc-cadmium efflux system membrane fusion protein
VEPGKELYLLSDLSEVWVFADVREGDLPLVAKRANGNGRIPAEVRASGGRTHKGTMDLLPGTMNEQTRTVKARIVVPNPDGHLRPGMFVTIRLLLEGGGNVLAVPKAAVLADEGRPFVFVHKEGEYWVRRPVTPGRRVGEMVEIVSGLSPGQRIIADGSFLLKSDVLRGKMGAGCAD